MRHPHLSDNRLIEVCLDLAPAAPERQHLESCDVCAGRRANLARLLTEVSDVASAEADVAFSAARLGSQHARILQCIEQDGRPGRVISFPAGQGPDPTPLRARPGMRWIAGAAAAGLVIGLFTGRLANILPAGGALPASQVAVAPAAATLQAVSTTMSEEEFLGLIEVAMEGVSGSTLRPLDDLTPLVWEVAAQ
ncbi:MAG: hypothetical protein EXQ53_11960 [Acidobacteria bacterium]|nr:hypothetical protein [Acidobacteriota bacterium]